jgi:hypothetical protein
LSEANKNLGLPPMIYGFWHSHSRHSRDLGNGNASVTSRSTRTNAWASCEETSPDSGEPNRRRPGGEVPGRRLATEPHLRGATMTAKTLTKNSRAFEVRVVRLLIV